MSERKCAKCGITVELEDGLVTDLADAVGQPLCRACFDVWDASRPKSDPPTVLPRQGKYKFTGDMGEISGFGGGYEQTCRNMVIAGVEWLDAVPDAAPIFKVFKEVYGLIAEDNEDAKELTKAVVAAADGDCTGAMHQAAISHCLFIRKNGWEKYVEEMSKPDDDTAKSKGG